MPAMRQLQGDLTSALGGFCQARKMLLWMDTGDLRFRALPTSVGFCILSNLFPVYVGVILANRLQN